MIRLWRKLLCILGLVVMVPVLVFLAVIVWHVFFFRAEIHDEIFLVQRPFQDIYDIKGDSRVLVSDAEGWAVYGHVMYGERIIRHGDILDLEFFSIDLNTMEVSLYSDLGKLDRYLKALGSAGYHMSDIQGSAVMRFGEPATPAYHKRMREQAEKGPVNW